MSSPTLPAATPPTTELKTGAVIKRLLRDYVSGEWGLLILALRYQVERRHQQNAAAEAQEALESA